MGFFFHSLFPVQWWVEGAFFFLSPSDQHPNILLSVQWWVLSFSFHFFSLEVRSTHKQESKQKKKDTKSKLKQILTYHSLLSPQNCMFLWTTFFSFLLSLTGISYQWHKQDNPNSVPIFIRPETQAHTFISSGGQLYFSELAPSDDSTYYCSVVLTSLGGTGTYIGSSREEVRTSLGFRLHVSSGGKGRHGAHHSVPRFETWN